MFCLSAKPYFCNANQAVSASPDMSHWDAEYMMLEYAYILTYFCAYKSGGVGRVRTSVCVIQQKEIGNFCNYFAGWEKIIYAKSGNKSL